MNLHVLLERMADGQFHSGEALGEVLGVSRTAVWKHLQKLESFGIALESVRGKGYRVPGGLELLDRALIEAGLNAQARALLTELEVLQSVDSTNSIAMARASRGNGNGYICLAEHQSSGRGRRGRKWVSPFGQSLYLSAVVEFSGGAAALEGLSLAVGVALVNALQELGAEGVGLKWPNDLLWDGRKLAGILLEMTGDPAGMCQVVVGVGLNVSVSTLASAEIDQPWAQLRELLPDLSRNQLVVALLNHLLPALQRFQGGGFGAFQEEWEALHLYHDRPVSMLLGNNRVDGIARGVSAAGALRVEVNGKIEEYNGGEVSLRALAGESGAAPA
ncbi:bifunctional biotin--[acetyl-CoA-carboxylase] ligase/biotin operon repressor BirA [Pseudomaricurvus alcaniphilus]|uniref:bifunctional biotin--[acetyl-CoA-carboxylase] ligase/biotin operon repressor BirA n=1 Tax=Pseudomaricurvus alcaniphilus TaxID=1166482 RepID=UPI0031329F16